MNLDTFFCTCPKNTGDLLIAEAVEAGAEEPREHTNGIEFAGSYETGYRLCLWSRIASRVLLRIGGFRVSSADELYEKSREIDWAGHMNVRNTFAVIATATKDSPVPNNFAVLRIKDAIADYFRDNTKGVRPSVDTAAPDLTFTAHINRHEALLYLDLSGQSLHRRGYRHESGPAPLKENVAAALLMRAGWKELCEEDAALVDPMCGSGTIPIEAALIAGDIAPGLLRENYGFESWKRHNAKLWRSLLEEAKERRANGSLRISRITGYDTDRRSVARAVAAAQRAGLSGVVHFERRNLTQARPAAGGDTGLVAVNPPYGVRLQDAESLVSLYSSLGDTLKESFKGWHAAILTGNKELSMETGLRASKTNTLYNGDIPCVLAQCDIFETDLETKTKKRRETYLEQFGNRLEKNYKRLSKWAAKETITCYRVYDADMPEFSAAIDLYENTWVHVQEYAPPTTIDPKQAKIRLQVILDTIPRVLNVKREDIYVKTRERQEKGSQYEQLGSTGVFNEIHEGGLSFLVNFADYLDTGIFLDHRITRGGIRELASDGDFLNLFSYTGTATAYAVSGGAKNTVSVDNSNTYTAWAKDNLHLNGMFDETLVRDEAREYLIQGKDRFDLIFIDPPTFSRSKRFKHTFQIQRDHVELIEMALHRLKPSGAILFSTNFRKFKLDYSAFEHLEVEDLTEQTIPEDFKRTPKMHQLWRISR